MTLILSPITPTIKPKKLQRNSKKSNLNLSTYLISRVVNYAKNPKKTLFSDLKQVLMYAENSEKTVDENEKNMYETGVIVIATQLMKK